MGSTRRLHRLLGTTLGVCMAIACGEAPAPEGARPGDAPASGPAHPDAATAGYVGDAACTDCHAEELRRWRGSHHDLAMQEATPDTVLGDFDAASLEQGGQRFEFLRDGERFVIRTAGADGAVEDFPVAYTFGVEPLQQYLVSLPGGRLQAVAAAWDSRPAEEGGQRWYHLQPDAPVPPGDPLHWTGLAGSWNAMCAECHSTNLAKGYRAGEDAYAPTWSSLDVSCEACHGPASAHVAWARGEGNGEGGGAERAGLPVALSSPHRWRFAEGARIAHRVPPPDAPSAEIDTCASCHSRRSLLVAEPAPGAPFLDTHRPALLEAGLYYPDGQIQDEVYVWGSFVQSRMYEAGVVCSDCHDPHGLRIADPDAACARCHAPAAFATPEHHHHAEGGGGASCVACHMPARTYMGVDARRDHGFRVPRPDQSASLGVPNPCTGCHGDRDARWAADATRRWRDDAPLPPHFGEVLAAGREHAPGAARALARLARNEKEPAIVRATALSLLATQLDRASAPAVFASLEDGEPLVRMAAAEAMRALPAQDRVVGLTPLLRDPRRVVRIAAGRVLAPLEARIPAAQTRDLSRALAEYRRSQEASLDRPEAHTNLGGLHAERGELAEARSAYEAALRVSPFFAPAAIQLAEVYRQEGREAEGERVLRETLRRVPEVADLHHALGLLLVRRGRSAEALPHLARASELAPESARYAYVYGIGLLSSGDPAAALRVLEDALRRHPGDPDILLALSTVHRDAGRRDRALEYARRLLALRPDDPNAQSLLRELSEGPPAPPQPQGGSG